MASDKVWIHFFGVLLLLFASFRSGVNGQNGNYANEIILGGIAATTDVLCWANSVNVKTFFRTPSRTLSFTTATAVNFIHCWNNLPLHPFTASIVVGGVGTTGLNTITLSGVTGKLVATCEAYCVMAG